MSLLAISPAVLASTVIALSFAAGLNVYATVFSLGVMARLRWVALPAGLESLVSSWIIVASGLLFATELVADKIPGFDLVWNALHTLVRIPVAALLAYEASTQLSPEMHLLATCAGGAIGALAHGSKTAVRMAVTPSPEPVSNIALSSTEDVLAIVLTWMATHHPIAAGVGGAILSVGSLVVLALSVRLIRRAVQRLVRGGPGGGLDAVRTKNGD